MDVPRRLLVVPLVAVLLPCAAGAVLGYKWLRIDRDAQVLRGRAAAEAEAARLRGDLLSALADASRDLSERWRGLPPDRPFAPGEPLPALVSAAFRVEPDGERLEPDYDLAYRETVAAFDSVPVSPAVAERTARAAALLEQGRAALEQRRYGAAVDRAEAILRCCAAARDEYGVSYSVYAARQVTAAWRASGSLPARFPGLARQLAALIDEGALGHPSDAGDIESIAKVGGASGATLAEAARQHAARIARTIALARGIERWLAAAASPKGGGAAFSLAGAWLNGRTELLGIYQSPQGPRYLTVIDQQRAASHVRSTSASSVAFDSMLTPTPGSEGGTLITFPLTAEVPSLAFVLRPRQSDAAAERRRNALFVGSLAAVLALVGALAYFALRDIGREVRMASLRSNFVTSVTHELKTPLTSIRLLAETLRLDRAPGASAAELLDGIVDESDRLGRLVDNVLSAARIDRGAAVYHPVEIDVCAAVDSALARFGPLLRREGFTVIREGDAAGVAVRADADGLAHAVANLLSNAVKYSGISREVRVGIFRTRDEIEVRVTDRGIGIPPGVQRKVFERFYRAPEAETEAAGAGLGLSLVRHFAEAHDGRVSLTSEPGAGSAFSVWLPVATSAHAPVGTPHELRT